VLDFKTNDLAMALTLLAADLFKVVPKSEFLQRNFEEPNKSPFLTQISTHLEYVCTPKKKTCGIRNLYFFNFFVLSAFI
jgi:hypothetical protein